MAFSFVAALMALIPAARRPKVALAGAAVDDKAHPRFIAGYDAGLSDGRRQVEQLHRSHQQLIEHIGCLESEVLAERERAAHWRDRTERLLNDPRLPPFGGQQQQAYQQQALAAYQQQMLGAQGLAQAQTYGYCDCSPSRAAMLNPQRGA
jgi:hypothetical protein